MTDWEAEVARREVINEGDRTVAYPDPLSPRAQTGHGSGDPWTIGIGQTGPHIVEGTVWTQQQVQEAFQADVPIYESKARGSLPAGVYDALSPARRFVIFDLCFNMGSGPYGWGGFTATHALIAAAVHTQNPVTAHALYEEAADHLTSSSWISQTGNRARRGIAMMRSSNWCDPNGDGSDVL